MNENRAFPGNDETIAGVMVAVVTNNSDPDKLGRVKLKYPLLEANSETDWVRVLAPFAGADRGITFLPEVNDEVLIAFHLGDPQKPYVIGSLWSKEKKPPDVGEKNKLHTMKTASGHQISFDDTDSKGVIKITTKKGQKIEIAEETDTITIADSSGNNTLTIKAGASAEVTVKCGASSVKMDAQGKVVLTASQELELTAPTVKISAQAQMDVASTGMLNVKSDGILQLKGSMTKIN